MALKPGSIIGGYRIERVLGAGGMGTVYLAQHPTLPRKDALKVLSSDLSQDREFVGRFEREANLAAALDHPNIVSVYNRGREDDNLWISMQYIEGTDAAEEVKLGPATMTPQRALRIVSEVGRGLDFAHRRGLLHRDVKPANFLLSRSNDPEDEERVLLTDFGVAKSTEDTANLTTTGSFLATIAYASPEQLTGEPLDHRADIYSLACSLYVMLTGENPYPSTMPAVVMSAHLHNPPPRPSLTRPGLPPGIDEVIAIAMSKNPAERFNTCREFVTAAASVLGNAPGYMPFAGSGGQGSDTGGQRTRVTGPTSMTGPTTGPRMIGPPTHLTSSAPFPGSHNPTVRTAPNKLRKWGVVAAAAALVVAVVVGFALWNSGSSDKTPSGPAALADVKAAHPAFAGKAIVALDFSDTRLAVDLDGSKQADFFRGIGFVYNSKYQVKGGESSPRTIDESDVYSIEGSLSSDTPTDVVIVFRSDKEAGGGGLRGLPSSITYLKAPVVVIDDKETVAAYQNWTDDSQAVMIAKVVPAIAKVLK